VVELDSISTRPTGRRSAELRPPERVSWAELGPEFLRRWGYPGGRREPEHIEILGPNGSGKSYFEKTILEERVRLRGSHVVILATKPADRTIKSLDWPVIQKWPPSYNQNQVIFWAKAQGLSKQGMERQRESIANLLTRLWEPDSNRIIVFDEIAYVEQELGLRPMLVRYFREARALGITIVATTQRPAGVTRYMHSESKWKICFAPADEDDTERVAQILGNKKYYREVLPQLKRERWEFLMVRTLTGEAYISRIPPRHRKASEKPQEASTLAEKKGTARE
jgi:hypothetical protein